MPPCWWRATLGRIPPWLPWPAGPRAAAGVSRAPRRWERPFESPIVGSAARHRQLPSGAPVCRAVGGSNGEQSSNILSPAAFIPGVGPLHTRAGLAMHPIRKRLFRAWGLSIPEGDSAMHDQQPCRLPLVALLVLL